ncbi:low temperature requirement protein LtrA [Nakamurella sp. UYEF19]|uniref:low temperature requirement protein A n=1 Tax=Nakamurella sp. UYEF19 TaxID=1756392 RepID=UPI0033986806
MSARSPDEKHRASTPLECLFDLCFVVAVARAGVAVEGQLGHGHVAAGVISYAMIFFAIWWAWMNFTWFASAYDNDDVLYRLTVMVQIAGSLILAAGVSPAFDPEHGDYSVLVIGYVVMRLGTVGNWIRAGRADPVHRASAYRYAAGVIVIQLGWVARLWLPESVSIISFVVLVLLEISVPIFSERAGVTPYHPSHIAERYGLFTVIVLGESVVAVVVSVEAAIHEVEHRAQLIGLAAAGLVILFSMWWVYFDKSAAQMLDNIRSSLVWGYGHYLIFGSIAAVGAGLNIVIGHDLGEIEVSDTLAGLVVTVPVALFLVVVWALHLRHHHGPVASAGFPVVAVLVLASTFSGAPVYLGAVLLVGLVILTVVTSSGRAVPRRAPAPRR